MKNIMIAVAISSMLSGSALAADLELKCYENKEFMKLVDEMDLVTIYNGFKTPEKVNDILLAKDRRIVTVEYDKATDGNALAATKYCVTGILNKVTFNDSTVEFLYNVLEKVKGQKT
jgi:hypothetical protein